jgi:hypothetical protein
VKLRPRGKSATSPPKALSSKSFELRGWLAIANFLGMPNSTVHRWAKEGMPIRREARNVVASPEELNQWLQRTSGEGAGVHVVLRRFQSLEGPEGFYGYTENEQEFFVATQEKSGKKSKALIASERG